MGIYKPSELMDFLKSLGISPKKSLSQNFLLDQNIIEKTLAVANVKENDTILEIGPGPGSITEALLKKGASVIAVEKDPIFAKHLERLGNKNLKVFCDDILTFPLESALSNKVKILANLPYHLTTPIITKLAPLHERIMSMTVFVQDEVASRFTAKPRTKDYSSISIFLQFYTEAFYAFKVSCNCFYPKPKVDSAVVHFTLREPPKVSNQDAFFKLVRSSFEKRRKMLRASLKELYKPERVMQALENLKLNPQARPEELTLEEFISVFETLNSSSQ